jgi:hypothetical protein
MWVVRLQYGLSNQEGVQIRHLTRLEAVTESHSMRKNLFTQPRLILDPGPKRLEVETRS